MPVLLPSDRHVDIDAGSDLWSDWLLHRRHGGDAAHAHEVRAEITRYADRVLDGACLQPHMTLADIGTGDGLVAWRAIERIGPSLRVVMTDVSAPLVRHAQAQAAQRIIAQHRSSSTDGGAATGLVTGLRHHQQQRTEKCR